MDGLYDAFIGSRVGFFGWFAKPGINKMRNFTKDFIERKGEGVYPTKVSCVSYAGD